ncbi:hypothetical protein DPMN_112022 [Dreissena polymorpha]|uniref:Uncharacterized protein n=1 Tax=Dreissena polymorpha TaxID=45954 RepID=A0A9D4KEY1_DREPO|nr:hypothetical protein DPMN_112022 [Dreissena polymorpha]
MNPTAKQKDRSSIFFLKVKGLSFSITKEGGCGGVGVGTGDGLVVSSKYQSNLIINKEVMNSHLRALEIIKEVKECDTARVKYLNGSKAAVIAAMKNVSFMALHDLPNSILGDLNDLCKEQGASQLASLKCDDHTRMSITIQWQNSGRQ